MRGEAVGTNDSTNGQQQAQEDAERRERAQNLEIPLPTRAAGIAAIALMPRNNRPNGPTQAELRSIALVHEAMELEEEADEALPPLYLGSEND